MRDRPNARHLGRLFHIKVGALSNSWRSRVAVKEPQDLKAREAVALGAILAGLVFSNVGMALVPALEYPIGGALHCSHGAGKGLLLPRVMRFHLPGREKRFARIAELLGQNVTGLSQNQAADRAIVAVEELNRAVGLKFKTVGHDSAILGYPT